MYIFAYIYICKVIMYIFALRAGKITIFQPKVVIFTAQIILQHFATKFCSFTHSETLFLAVMLDFVLLALIKI